MVEPTTIAILVLTGLAVVDRGRQFCAWLRGQAVDAWWAHIEVHRHEQTYGRLCKRISATVHQAYTQGALNTLQLVELQPAQGAQGAQGVQGAPCVAWVPGPDTTVKLTEHISVTAHAGADGGNLVVRLVLWAPEARRLELNRFVADL